MTECLPLTHSPDLASPPQLHHRSSGVGFSYGVHHIDPSHTQFTGGFTLLWESNAATDLPGGGAQVVLSTTGNGCKYSHLQRGSFARPPLTSCNVAQFLTGHGLILVYDPGVGDPCCIQQLHNFLCNWKFVALNPLYLFCPPLILHWYVYKDCRNLQICPGEYDHSNNTNSSSPCTQSLSICLSHIQLLSSHITVFWVWAIFFLPTF